MTNPATRKRSAESFSRPFRAPFISRSRPCPKSCASPISLAYLLARTADTIADTAQVPADTRLQSLARFRDLVLGPPNDEEERSLGIFLQGRFCPASDRRVRGAAHGSFPRRHRLVAHRHALAAHRHPRSARHVVRGQVLDIQHFPADGPLRALKNRDELDDYTWLVAGCVGEFWTKLCLADLPSAFSEKTRNQTNSSSSAFATAKASQLINILRDLPEDIPAGRCYLPRTN